MYEYDEGDLEIVANARRMFAANPNDEDARGVLEDFSRGECWKSLGWWLIPYDEAKEEERSKKYCDEVLARYREDKPLYEVADKCQKFFRPHSTREGCLEGIRSFIARTGLTVERIRQMSVAELEVYR